MDWEQIRSWRKTERERIIGARLEAPAEKRAAMSARIAEHLEQEIASAGARIVSFYWPFRGEPDLRPLLARLEGKGVTTALPVVVAKAQPLAFRLYAPGDPLEKGVWNIPVPASGAEVTPDLVVAPVVGIDRGFYRLGYGGGFFDRTLASLSPRPRAIGVGYEMQRIATIHPQPHDIPMAALITEAGLFHRG